MVNELIFEVGWSLEILNRQGIDAYGNFQAERVSGQEKHGNKTTPWQAIMPMLDVKGVGQTLSSLN